MNNRNKFSLFSAVCMSAILLALISFSLSVASCSSNLDPAGTAGSTVVRMQLGTVAGSSARTASSSRAIVQNGGYLYIRLGGVSSGGQRLYGPYEVSSSGAFSTTEIPAGVYPFIALFYSSELIDTMTYYDAQENTHTIGDRLVLDDTDFLLLKTDTYFSEAFQGLASGTFLNTISIVAGRETAIAATLVPLGMSDEMTTDNIFSSLYLSPPADTSKLVRRFVIMEDTYGVSNGNSVTETITPDSDSSLNLVGAYLYDENNQKLSLTYTPGTYTNTTPASLIYTFPESATKCYLYLEYYSTGNFTLSQHIY